MPSLDPSLSRARAVRFWVYIGVARHPYTVYDFTPNRSRDGPHRSLGSFSGYLQADAFAGYRAERDRGLVREARAVPLLESFGEWFKSRV